MGLKLKDDKLGYSKAILLFINLVLGFLILGFILLFSTSIFVDNPINTFFNASHKGEISASNLSTSLLVTDSLSRSLKEEIGFHIQEVKLKGSFNPNTISKGYTIFANSFKWISTLFVIIIFWQFRKILVNVLSKKVFCPENYRRLRIAAFSAILLDLIRISYIWYDATFIYKDFVKHGIQISNIPMADFQSIGFFLGCALLVVTEIIRVGNNLREENELTV